MKSFIERHREKIKGVLSGLDRIRFRGTLRALAHAWGMHHYLLAAGVLLRDFGAYARDSSAQVRRATETWVREQNRPLQFVRSSQTSKEEVALAIARRDGIQQGLVAVLSALEMCWSFEIGFDRQTRHIELRSGQRKCLHYYHYFLDPEFGLMHARVQSWLPFTIHVCLNGRDWLARQMDRAGLGYQQRDNCFIDVADFGRAQKLLHQQLAYDWPKRLDRLARLVQPAHAALFGQRSLQYYWSVDESEWATDIAFRDPAELARLRPRLVRHGLETLSSHDVLRFLGRKHPEWCSRAEVSTDYQMRPEGVCVKHRVNNNVVKMYDKQRSVLRVETVINNAGEFQSYRTAEGEPADAPKKWRPMRKGVADLPRRAEVSQAANDRYLQSLAAASLPPPLVEKVCRPTRWQGRRARALNPLAAKDARLLEAVMHGEFALNGFRNRDLRPLLFGDGTVTPVQQRKQSAAVTRQLRLLRAHGLIRKVAHTHRYKISDQGTRIMTALLTARKANTSELSAAA